jgi:hypothetical protein
MERHWERREGVTALLFSELNFIDAIWRSIGGAIKDFKKAQSQNLVHGARLVDVCQ